MSTPVEEVPSGPNQEGEGGTSRSYGAEEASNRAWAKNGHPVWENDHRALQRDEEVHSPTFCCQKVLGNLQLDVVCADSSRGICHRYQDPSRFWGICPRHESGLATQHDVSLDFDSSIGLNDQDPYQETCLVSSRHSPWVRPWIVDMLVAGMVDVRLVSVVEDETWNETQRS